MRMLRATCIVTGPVIWHHMKIPHKHAAISVRNPQAARPRSRSALQQANTLRRSEITNFRVSSALECLAHVMEARWRQDFTRGDRCPRLHAPPNGFHFEEPDGNWVLVFLFFRPGCGGHRGPAHSNSVITDKLGSVMPAVNVASPNLKRTIPSVRSKTD